MGKQSLHYPYKDSDKHLGLINFYHKDYTFKIYIKKIMKYISKRHIPPLSSTKREREFLLTNILIKTYNARINNQIKKNSN